MLRCVFVYMQLRLLHHPHLAIEYCVTFLINPLHLNPCQFISSFLLFLPFNSQPHLSLSHQTSIHLRTAQKDGGVVRHGEVFTRPQQRFNCGEANTASTLGKEQFRLFTSRLGLLCMESFS